MHYRRQLYISTLFAIFVSFLAGFAPGTIHSLKQEFNAKATKARHTQLLTEFSQSTRFVRGEIEEPLVQQRLRAELKLSLTKSEKHASAGQIANLRSEIFPWILFAADSAYEEGNVAALRFCHEIRSEVLSFFESLTGKQTGLFSPEQLPDWLQWLILMRKLQK